MRFTRLQENIVVYLFDFKDSNETNSGSCFGETKAQEADPPKLPIEAITYDYSQLSAAFSDGSNLLKQRNEHLDHYLAKYNVLKGFRHSSFQAFLRPALHRGNLKILLNTRVHKVRVGISEVRSLAESFFSGKFQACSSHFRQRIFRGRPIPLNIQDLRQK